MYGLTKWKARSEKPLQQSLPFFFSQSPHPDYDGVSAKGRRELKTEASKGKKALANRLKLYSSTLKKLDLHYLINHPFRSCSCSSFFPLPLPDRIFKSPLSYTSLKLWSASLWLAPRCRTRIKTSKKSLFQNKPSLMEQLSRESWKHESGGQKVAVNPSICT